MERTLHDPPVTAVMTRDVVAIGPRTGLQAAAHLLTEHGIGGAPVVTADGRAVGFVSLSDLASGRETPRAGAGPEPGGSLLTDGWAAQESGEGEILDTYVEDVMTRDVYCVDETCPASEAARLMVNRKIHRLLVTRDVQLVGIVSTLDLLRGLVGEPDAGLVDSLRLDASG